MRRPETKATALDTLIDRLQRRAPEAIAPSLDVDRETVQLVRELHRLAQRTPYRPGFVEELERRLADEVESGLPPSPRSGATARRPAWPQAFVRDPTRIWLQRLATVCAPQAILLTGSTASGTADCYSDIDMLVYYEAALSTAEQLEAAREEIGAQDLREPANLGIKAIMGVQSGIPLHGSDLIHTWQARINQFSDRLARGMVEHDLRELFPEWYFAEAMQRRDCAAWLHQMLAETALNALGVLAGLNRQYFVPFQFKRTRRFVDSLRIAPEDLTERQRQHLGPGAERAGLVDQGDVGRVGQAGQVAGHRGGADAHEAHVVV